MGQTITPLSGTRRLLQHNIGAMRRNGLDNRAIGLSLSRGLSAEDRQWLQEILNVDLGPRQVNQNQPSRRIQVAVSELRRHGGYISYAAVVALAQVPDDWWKDQRLAYREAKRLVDTHNIRFKEKLRNVHSNLA